MARATRMQVRPRGIAAITALAFVLGGVLAMRHEAVTAHVRDHAGAFFHARALVGHHTGHTADIHGQRNPDADTGDCALLTTFHQAARAEFAAPAVVAAVVAFRRADIAHAAIPTADSHVYRLAPKTSPPAAV